jgi:hypothetical protein
MALALVGVTRVVETIGVICITSVPSSASDGGVAGVTTEAAAMAAAV